MKFKTFMCLVLGGLFLVTVFIIYSCGDNDNNNTEHRAQQAEPRTVRQPQEHVPPVYTPPTPAHNPPLSTQEPRHSAPSYALPSPLLQHETRSYSAYEQDDDEDAQPSISVVRKKIERWLTDYPDRKGKNRFEDLLPAESFKATAVRFSENDAVKWSNDTRQWSQIKLDLNRDGVDDEKWLLKNGHTYKREALDRNGRVTSTEYFN